MSAATGELSAAVTASVPAIPPVVRLHTHAVADLTQQVLLLTVESLVPEQSMILVPKHQTLHLTLPKHSFLLFI